MVLLYLKRVQAMVLSSSFCIAQQIMYPHIPPATINIPKLTTDSFFISKTNWRRWYSSNFYLCLRIVDSAIGIIGVFLNSYTGRNSMKFLGSSAQIEPGIDKLTTKVRLSRSRYLESWVNTCLKGSCSGMISLGSLIDPQSQSSLLYIYKPLQQSSYELQTVIPKAFMIF